jgi:hypothetical protein
MLDIENTAIFAKAHCNLEALGHDLHTQKFKVDNSELKFHEVSKATQI